MQAKTLKRSAMGAAVVLALGAGYQFGQQAVGSAHAAEATVDSPTAVAQVTLPDFEDIAVRLGPAVVNIRVEGNVKTAMAPHLAPQDPRHEFFRRFGPGLTPPGGERSVRGQGSGFIVSEDGLILTNAHVVDGATEVMVRLTDRREFSAEVIGLDKPTDVAVLKIDADDLPTVPVGDPASARVGGWVLAIGSPFGFENSVTAGIVSAKSRSLPNDGYVPFIQTDVAINPGNSGGPLLNLAGEVIGINSQIYSRSGGYQGLSFAIPIDVAVNVKNQLVATGKVTRGRVGVGIQDLNQGLAESFGLESSRGALVTQVEKGSPAEQAGLQSGDVILALQGKPVERSADLPPRVGAMSPGSEATMSIWRDGERKQLEVTIGTFDTDSSQQASVSGAGKGRLGLALRPLSPQEKKRADAGEGLLVLEADGPAARAGIRPGDVVLALNGRAVGSVTELSELLGESGKHVALLVQRKSARLFVPVELG